MIPKNLELDKIVNLLKDRGIVLNDPTQYVDADTKIAATCLKTHYGSKGEWTPKVRLIERTNSCCPICARKKASIAKANTKTNFGIEFNELIQSTYSQTEYNFTGSILVRKIIAGRKREFLGEVEHDCGYKTFKTLKTIKGYECPICSLGTFDKNNEDFNGLEEISESHFNKIKERAKRQRGNQRTLEFTLTREYIWELYLRQEGRCALSGEKIYFGSGRRNKNTNSFRERTASLDRIDSKKGYVPDNVQWVNKYVNFMKQSMSDECFIEWCTKIARYERSEKKGKVRIGIERLNSRRYERETPEQTIEQDAATDAEQIRMDIQDPGIESLNFEENELGIYYMNV